MITPQIGLTCKLISGGPSMTIVDIGTALYRNHKVLCEWYDGNAAKQSEWYPPESLIPAPKVGDSAWR